MGECILHGASGGAASLNFRIVGGTSAPVSPTENTIWVNTSYEITSYVFASETPESAQDGCVWIKTGISSIVEFSLTKKDSIMIYPLIAKQYIDGAWADMSAKSYQDGEWVEWVTYLYNLGDECEDVTGGWVIAKDCNGSISKNTDKITFDVSGANGRYTYALIHTANPIDLTDKINIKVNDDWVETLGSFSNTKIGISKTKPTSVTTGAEVVATGESSLSVDGISGEYYIFVGALVGDNTTIKVKLNITDITLS